MTGMAPGGGRGGRRVVAALALTAAVVGLSQGSARAQVTPLPTLSSRATDADSTVAPVPFGPGERLVYKVKLGIWGGGEGVMVIPAVEDVRGNDAYHFHMAVDAGALGFCVRDKFDSWMDTRTLQAWRFIQDIDDPGYSSFRHYEFYPDRQIWDREDNDESGPLATPLPLDDISFIHFVRTLPLEVGKTYTFNRYFKAEGNPVTLKVLRKDKRKTDAGEFNTIVVQPIIRTKGMFSQGGKAELHFTDDERRILVFMKTDIPILPGALTLHLQSIQEGLPLHPTPRARALSGENRVGSDPRARR